MAKKRKPTKEQIYDAQISPLMAQIIVICKEHKIPIVASFGLGQDENGDLHCTTTITPDEFEPSDLLLELNRRIYPPPKPLTMLTVRDGDGKVKSMTAIV